MKAKKEANERKKLAKQEAEKKKKEKEEKDKKELRSMEQLMRYKLVASVGGSVRRRGKK